MTPAVFDQTTIDIQAGRFLFRATGSVQKFDGFLKLYQEGRDEKAEDDEEAERSLPLVEKGETLIQNSAVERWRFRRCVTHGLRGDTRLRERQVEAVAAGAGAGVLPAHRARRRSDSRTRSAATTRASSPASSRWPTTCPTGSVRLLALAKVDRLLDRRGDMQRAYTQLRTRPFRDARRLQLERELRRNARDTRAAVRELIADLQLLSTP